MSKSLKIVNNTGESIVVDMVDIESDVYPRVLEDGEEVEVLPDRIDAKGIRIRRAPDPK